MNLIVQQLTEINQKLSHLIEYLGKINSFPYPKPGRALDMADCKVSK